jgi:hypothetical protein
MLKFNTHKILMDKAGDDAGGGGGDDKKATPDDLRKEIDAIKAQNQDLLSKIEKLVGKPDTKNDDDDLATKAKKQRESDDKNAGDQKALEAALRFSLKSDEFLKTNAALLPKDVADIFKAAEKEKFNSAIEKDAAVKSGIIQSFFSIQANLDLLTPAVKIQLEDYLKLTKNGKQEKAQEIYDMIFEPAFEMLKRVKKAEMLQKGLSDGSDDALIQKRIERSSKHYLREKSQ